MKKILLALSLCVAYACTSVLDIDQLGSYKEEHLQNKAGIEGLLIGSYSRLHAGGYAGYQNWVFGSIAAEDAYKGSDDGDQPPINEIERYTTQTGNSYAKDKWNALYGNISACNKVINTANATPAGVITEDFRTVKIAEARFLRALNYLELQKVFGKPAWIDENDALENNPIKGNKESIWPKIEADLLFCVAKLPDLQPEVGRAYKWAAKALLAKVYLFQNKHNLALPILTDIIDNGRNAKGVKFDLVPKLYDIYNVENKNNLESVFALQCSVFDGSNGIHGNAAMRLNYPHGSTVPGGCCGFYQPSHNIVNSFKVDANGLPMLDTYNDVNFLNDQGIESKDPFSPDRTTAVDPRLDWTVGRRGMPFLDWGMHQGKAWIRDQKNGGPYTSMKHMYLKSQKDQFVEYDWSPRTAMNYEIIRFADVLLWAAECEIEVGTTGQAMAYINRVRARAANTVNFKTLESGLPAANYKVGLYITFPSDKVEARKLVRFERKIELALEGHRFFDLVRWGEAKSTLNAYLAVEGSQTPRQPYLQGVTFKDQYNYMPIPDDARKKATVNGVSLLEQNQGYTN